GDGTYLVDFMITGTTEQPLDFTLSQAWKKVNLWDLADFQIGRNVLSYGRICTSRGSRNLQIQPLHVAPVVWSFKLHKQLGKIHLYSDAVWPQVGLADAAGRLAYESDKLTIGASGVMGHLSEWFKEDGTTEGAWAFDIDFVLANFLRVSGQFSRERVGSEDNYYVIASYDPGFEMPYMGKRIGRVIYGEWRPYFGMITRNGDDDGEGMGDSNMFGGINYQSFEKSYMKFEVNIDSNDDIDPTFLVQLGYKF
ncbi:MAG: hypothetical protein K9N40_02655, partial [Candidatus Cloacimonetes bacterium]|nr:hypothetical protein [Candidatus Cloacimonadota bacterium]